VHGETDAEQDDRQKCQHNQQQHLSPSCLRVRH
jgi:hypothetical protein